MSEHEDRAGEDVPRSHEDDPDVEAQGLREVMTVGLAAAAFVGVPPAAKAAGTATGPEGQTVLVETAAKADLDLDGFLSFGELEKAAYKVSVELLQDAGYSVTLESLEKAGYKASGRLLPQFVEGDTVMLKRGVDVDLDVMLDYGIDAWPSKLREIDADGDGYLSF